ncbi:FAD-dependent monooxygenase [Thioalkalivibrio sp. ALE20]|uniref:FAD-dependent monooxygenase n=1 Tax=Thioalkalivibrio sp. ALE20 TaxID=545275 RepID=UPI00036554A0|nr:FAD-dependent monooxygenase [Thioalkalivibrio sp. ALE20]
MEATVNRGTQTQTQTETDIAVVGGGPVGGLAACTLARAGYTVRLFERGPAPDPAVPREDTRGYALAAGSVTLLDDLGYWAELATTAAPIRRIVVSRRGGLGRVRMDAAQMGREALGQVVPAAALDPLLARARDAAGVASHHATTLAGVEAAADGARRLHLEGPDGAWSCRARLLIAADGVGSPTREALGIPVQRHRYDADALVFDVRPSRAHDGEAFERFTDEGPVALLPQADGRMNVVWVAPPEVCDARLELDESARMAALQGGFGWALGRLHPAGGVLRFPLQRMHAPQPFAERALLLGNAAHSVHPVAGQGLNLALRDVADLLGVLREGAQPDGRPAFVADPGGRHVLEAWARRREGDIRRIVGVTDFLARGMRHVDGLLGHALGLGMMTVDRVPPLRDAFARGAMGLRPVPRHTLSRLPETRA